MDNRHAAEEERTPEDATLDKLGNFTQGKLKKYLTTRSISDTTNIYLLGEKKKKKKHLLDHLKNYFITTETEALIIREKSKDIKSWIKTTLKIA